MGEKPRPHFSSLLRILSFIGPDQILHFTSHRILMVRSVLHCFMVLSHPRILLLWLTHRAEWSTIGNQVQEAQAEVPPTDNPDNLMTTYTLAGICWLWCVQFICYLKSPFLKEAFIIYRFILCLTVALSLGDTSLTSFLIQTQTDSTSFLTIAMVLSFV